VIVSSGVFDSTFSAVHPCVLPNILSQVHPSLRTWALKLATKALLSKALLFARAFLNHVRASSDLNSAKHHATTRSRRVSNKPIVAATAQWHLASRLNQPSLNHLHPPRSSRLNQPSLNHLHPPRSICNLLMRPRLQCPPAMEGIHAGVRARQHIWVAVSKTLVCLVLFVSLLVLKIVKGCCVLPQLLHILIRIQTVLNRIWCIVWVSSEHLSVCFNYAYHYRLAWHCLCNLRWATPELQMWTLSPKHVHRLFGETSQFRPGLWWWCLPLVPQTIVQSDTIGLGGHSRLTFLHFE
jgi:hypothetical protein